MADTYDLWIYGRQGKGWYVANKGLTKKAADKIVGVYKSKGIKACAVKSGGK